jgi:hypothetical protein
MTYSIKWYATFKTREEVKKEAIEKIAYDFWEKSGCPENKSLEFWALAEKEYKKNELLDSFNNSKIFVWDSLLPDIEVID